MNKKNILMNIKKNIIPIIALISSFFSVVLGLIFSVIGVFNLKKYKIGKSICTGEIICLAAIAISIARLFFSVIPNIIYENNDIGTVYCNIVKPAREVICEPLNMDDGYNCIITSCIYAEEGTVAIGKDGEYYTPVTPIGYEE